MRYTVKKSIGALGTLAALILAKQREESKAGSPTLTYDFRDLPDSAFEDRRLKRYKKKFPRYRIIPKLALGYQIHVFYFPKNSLEDEDGYALTGAYWDMNNLPELGLRANTEDVKIMRKVYELSTDPKNKILLLGRQAQPEQISPYLMLHALGEAVFTSTATATSVGAQDTIIIEPAPVQSNAVLPNNLVIRRAIKRKNIPDGYGFPNRSLLATARLGSQFITLPYYSRNEICSDSFANMLAKGRIDWLTPNNSPELKTAIESMYTVIRYPDSYQPLIDMWELMVDNMIMTLNEHQIFIA